QTNREHEERIPLPPQRPKGTPDDVRVEESASERRHWPEDRETDRRTRRVTRSAATQGQGPRNERPVLLICGYRRMLGGVARVERVAASPGPWARVGAEATQLVCRFGIRRWCRTG